MPSLAAAAALIKEFEGCKLQSYQDTGRVWTIGYGATGPDVDENTTWTQAQADDRLASDLANAFGAVHAHIAIALNENQQTALASFVFNLGETQFAKSTLLKKINAGDQIGAALEFTKWHFDNKKPIKGLLRRRLTEAALFLK